MSQQTIVLALLVFAIVATRPLEEQRWRTGRISDRTAALLVVGRVPVLIGGFALITERTIPVLLVMALIALAVAAVLYPFVLGRLRRAARQS